MSKLANKQSIIVRPKEHKKFPDLINLVFALCLLSMSVLMPLQSQAHKFKSTSFINDSDPITATAAAIYMYEVALGLTAAYGIVSWKNLDATFPMPSFGDFNFSGIKKKYAPGHTQSLIQEPVKVQIKKQLIDDFISAYNTALDSLVFAETEDEITQIIHSFETTSYALNHLLKATSNSDFIEHYYILQKGIFKNPDSPPKEYNRKGSCASGALETSIKCLKNADPDNYLTFLKNADLTNSGQLAWQKNFTYAMGKANNSKPRTWEHYLCIAAGKDFFMGCSLASKPKANAKQLRLFKNDTPCAIGKELCQRGESIARINSLTLKDLDAKSTKRIKFSCIQGQKKCETFSKPKQ